MMSKESVKIIMNSNKLSSKNPENPEIFVEIIKTGRNDQTWIIQ